MNSKSSKSPSWSWFIRVYASATPFVALPMAEMGAWGILLAVALASAGYVWALAYAVRSRRAEEAQPPKDLVLGFIFYHALALAPVAILARMLAR